jgi:hypothetical protein
MIAERTDSDQTVGGANRMLPRVLSRKPLAGEDVAARGESELADPHSAPLYRLVSPTKKHGDFAVDQADEVRSAFAVEPHVALTNQLEDCSNPVDILLSPSRREIWVQVDLPDAQRREIVDRLGKLAESFRAIYGVDGSLPKQFQRKADRSFDLR